MSLYMLLLTKYSKGSGRKLIFPAQLFHLILLSKICELAEAVFCKECSRDVILLISKFNVGPKSFLNQCLSEPEFYGDLVYKFKKSMYG